MVAGIDAFVANFDNPHHVATIGPNESPCHSKFLVIVNLNVKFTSVPNCPCGLLGGLSVLQNLALMPWRRVLLIVCVIDENNVLFPELPKSFYVA